MSNEVRINIITKLIDKGLDDLDDKLKKASGILENIGKAGLGAGVAAGGALAAGAVSAVNFADEVNAAVNSISKQTGVSGDELAEYKKIATSLFAGPPPVADSIDEVADSLSQTANITELTGDALKGATKDAGNLAATFDKDINEVLRAADSLVRNEVAGSFDEAFDLIAKGFTEGADRGDDFLDTLNEYAQDFGDLGFTAQETLNIINNGLEAGVLNSDKIGDAFNEAGINFKDIAKQDAIKELVGQLGDLEDPTFRLGQSMQGLFNRINETGRVHSGTFNMMFNNLKNVDDATIRNAIGVELFGSMWEDLGEEAIMALQLTGEQLDNTEMGVDTVSGAMDELSNKPQSLEALWTSSWRNIQIAIEPLGQEIIPLLSDVLLDFIEIASDPEIQELAKQLGTNLVDAISESITALGEISQALGLTQGDSEGVAAAIEGIISIAGGLGAVIGIFADAAEQAGALADQINTIKDLVSSGDADLSGGLGGLGSLQNLNPFSGTFAANATKGLLGFEDGGIVPGRSGEPQLAVVHGGEEVIPVGGSKDGITININGAVFGVDDLDRHINMATQKLADQIATQSN